MTIDLVVKIKKIWLKPRKLDKKRHWTFSFDSSYSGMGLGGMGRLVVKAIFAVRLHAMMWTITYNL